MRREIPFIGLFIFGKLNNLRAFITGRFRESPRKNQRKAFTVNLFFDIINNHQKNEREEKA